MRLLKNYTKISSHVILKETYLEVKKSLEEFINENSERQFLSSWLSWWDNRRTFIFGAFASTNVPRIIHAGWAHKGPSNLFLLDAAHTDTRDSVLLAVELRSIEQGTSKGGTGPSYEERKTKLRRQWYEVVTLPGNVKKYYSCGAEYTDRHRSPPYNIVVKHVDR